MAWLRVAAAVEKAVAIIIAARRPCASARTPDRPTYYGYAYRPNARTLHVSCLPIARITSHSVHPPQSSDLRGRAIWDLLLATCNVRAQVRRIFWGPRVRFPYVFVPFRPLAIYLVSASRSGAQQCMWIVV